jgi:hypothetical protein
MGVELDRAVFVLISKLVSIVRCFLLASPIRCAIGTNAEKAGTLRTPLGFPF